MKRLVVGILAHVDSGKTTLSEGLLYRSGEIRKLGRVDHGDAFLDTHALERERGITIFSKQAVLRLEDTEITLLDTPGHVDFSTEMERTLQVLDYAILVISGTDGVQSHTETLWRLLARYQVPTFLFVNKMDLAGADQEALLQQLRRRLGDGCVDFGSSCAESGSWLENLALCSETLMDRYLETGNLSTAEIAAAVAERKIFPCYFGSALKLEGIDEFLSLLDKYTQAQKFPREFGARVFKISVDDQGNRLTHFKITGGSLKVKTALTGTANQEIWEEKVNHLRVYSGSKFQAVEEAFPGMVCAAAGLSRTYPGEGLGTEPDSQLPVLQPVLSYRVELPPKADAHTALTNLRRLEEEDPQLHVVWNELQEIHVQLMGEVQLEILKRLILERFGLEVNFGQGNIIYKETITTTVEGVGHFEPLRHYAEVHLLLEPGPRGSGLRLASTCREDDLDRNWQRLILTHLEEKIHLGVLTGSPITDLKITLAAGRAHLKHTEGGDFRQATYRAVRQGLRQAKSILLEPWYDFRLTVPSENIGRAMSDLQRMNGTFAPPENEGESSVLTGSVPASELRDYAMEVTGYTRGKGRLSCTLKGYGPCHNEAEVVAAMSYDCDDDLENTADSVFCSHGAGYLVKWDQVPQHMHLPSVLNPPQEQEPPEERTVAQRTADYCSRMAADSELMAIFERTYGPIRKNSQTAFRPSSRSKPPERVTGKAQPQLAGPEYLLVDGYNIIFAWDELNRLAKQNVEAARKRLIDILCNFQGYRQCELILVFDAYKVKGNPGEVEKHGNISVVYTREAETADMYIEKVTHNLARKHRVRVATSDALEQLIILGHGALRVSAASFQEEVLEVEKAIRSFLEQ